MYIFAYTKYSPRKGFVEKKKKKKKKKNSFPPSAPTLNDFSFVGEGKKRLMCVGGKRE